MPSTQLLIPGEASASGPVNCLVEMRIEVVVNFLLVEQLLAGDGAQKLVFTIIPFCGTKQLL